MLFYVYKDGKITAKIKLWNCGFILRIASAIHSAPKSAATGRRGVQRSLLLILLLLLVLLLYICIDRVADFFLLFNLGSHCIRQL